MFGELEWQLSVSALRVGPVWEHEGLFTVGTAQHVCVTG